MAGATSTSNVPTESLYVCRTNDSKAMEHLYGRNICGVFGCKSALLHLTLNACGLEFDGADVRSIDCFSCTLQILT